MTKQEDNNQCIEKNNNQ